MRQPTRELLFRVTSPQDLTSHSTEAKAPSRTTGFAAKASVKNSAADVN